MYIFETGVDRSIFVKFENRFSEKEKRQTAKMNLKLKPVRQ
jgi:hypothetical protein